MDDDEVSVDSLATTMTGVGTALFAVFGLKMSWKYEWKKLPPTSARNPMSVHPTSTYSLGQFPFLTTRQFLDLVTTLQCASPFCTISHGGMLYHARVGDLQRS